jgi:hypothetical protein
MRRPNLFTLDAPARRLWPKEFREAIGVRSDRTVDGYRKQPGFPQGRLERSGLMEVRTWSPADVFTAQAWLASRGLPGPRASHRKIANLAKARTAAEELDQLVTLAARLLRVAGVGPVVEALRPLDGEPLDRIAPSHRLPVRAALIRALEPFNR